MFKAFARKSASLTLNHFISYLNGRSSNIDRVRTFLALFFRNMIKTSESLVGRVDGPDQLNIAIARLQLSVDKKEAFSIADQMQRNAKLLPKGQFHDDDKNSMLFIGSYFHMLSEVPEARKAMEMKIDGRPDKSYTLLTQFEEVLLQLFKGYEEYLLSDIAIKGFDEFKVEQKEKKNAH